MYNKAVFQQSPRPKLRISFQDVNTIKIACARALARSQRIDNASEITTTRRHDGLIYVYIRKREKKEGILYITKILGPQANSSLHECKCAPAGSTSV